MRINRIVDLSVPVGPDTVVYPGDPVPVLTEHSTVAREGYNTLHVAMGSHTGTHVDAPYHVDDGAARIDEVPLDRFLGPAVVVDASALGPRAPITWEHVAPVADRLGAGNVVLLRTDWSLRYGDPSYFDHPWLAAQTCERLLALGVRTFFIDAPSIDETPDPRHPGLGLPAHRMVAEASGVIGENVRNLAQVAWPEPVVMALPLALVGADGAPVRAVAVELVE